MTPDLIARGRSILERFDRRIARANETYARESRQAADERATELAALKADAGPEATTRALAEALGVSHQTIAVALRRSIRGRR